MLFEDRRDAGRKLAEKLQEYRGKDALVLGLPRGGVAIGYEVALALDLPLDVIITRKIGAPGNPEYAIGALAENGELALNQQEIATYGIPASYINSEVQRQEEEIARRVQLYRDGGSLPPLKGRIAIVVDDGVATGFTTATAIKAVRKEGPAETVLGVPVGPIETIQWLGSLADRVVCLATPDPFFAVGRFYVNFNQVEDADVRRYLEASRRRERGAALG